MATPLFQVGGGNTASSHGMMWQNVVNLDVRDTALRTIRNSFVKLESYLQNKSSTSLSPASGDVLCPLPSPAWVTSSSHPQGTPTSTTMAHSLSLLASTGKGIPLLCWGR